MGWQYILNYALAFPPCGRETPCPHCGQPLGPTPHGLPRQATLHAGGSTSGAPRPSTSGTRRLRRRRPCGSQALLAARRAKDSG